MQYEMNENVFMDEFRKLLAIDSTSGMIGPITEYITGWLDEGGFEHSELKQGGVLVPMGGEGNPLLLCAHLDDIGAVVRFINPDGTLKVCPVGGFRPLFAERANARVHTLDGKVYTGAFQRPASSVHVTEDDYWKQPADFNTNVMLLLDEDVHTAADVRALGIETGDFVALDPDLQVSNGFIKSRFIDDKAIAASLMCAMKDIREQKIPLSRKVTIAFTLFEEIGHGINTVPEDTRDMIAMDIAPVAPEQTSDEHKVTIFRKDTRFPYHEDVVREMRDAALRCGADYALDVFTPHYGTDCDTTLAAGCDVRHGAFGPGTRGTHGYERTHMDGLKNTYKLAMELMTGTKAD